MTLHEEKIKWRVNLKHCNHAYLKLDCLVLSLHGELKLEHVSFKRLSHTNFSHLTGNGN